MEANFAPHFSSLGADVRRILDRLQQEALVPLNVLAGELTAYTAELERQAQRIEFYDLATARHAATLCHKLLASLPEAPTEDQHRLTQLAINYFVLAEDAEDDNYSIVGFDDDLQVVATVIEALGLNHLLENRPSDG